MRFASSLACGALSAACLLGASEGLAAGVDRAASGLAPAVVSIEMRAKARATGQQVRLGDIAFLTSADLVSLRRLMALPIGAAPRPGAPTVVDRDTLSRWVAGRSGLQFARGEATVASERAPILRWTGASETEIESEAQQLQGDAVVEAARASLTAWLSQRSVRAEVQALSPTRDLMLPAGTPVLRVRPLSDQAQPARRMLVWVDAWVDNRFVRTTAVSFEVGAWAPMTVATRGVDRGTTLDPALLRDVTESRDVDLTTLRNAKPLAGVREAELDAGSQRLRRPLRAGEVLTEAHLEAAPAVVRGQPAHLLARSGEVSVESRVEVLQDGRQGQVVRVKVPGASGEVLARVTGPGQVEVQP